MFWISYDLICHKDDIADMQGVDGWRIHSNRATNGISITYTLEGGIAAA